MLRLRPTYEEIAREARTRRLRILPEKERRTQQGLLLDDVSFDDFDLGKYDKKTILFNANPDKGTQTDVFNETPSVSESESMKSLEEDARNEPRVLRDASAEASRGIRDVKQRQRDESLSSIQSSKKEEETEREREQPQKKSFISRVYDAMFGEDEFKEEREEMRSRRQQIDTDEEQIIVQPEASIRSQESDDDLPMNVKKSYEPSSSSSRRSSNRSVLLPVEEEALSEHIHSSPPETVQSSVPSDRTVEYIEEASPPQSVISSRRSQETIEYIRSRSSSNSRRTLSS